MVQISHERKLKFLQQYINEYVDKWPVKIKPFDRWLESTLDKRVHKGRVKVVEYTKRVCHYCHRSFEETGIDKTKDHIVPLSRGGLDWKENRVPCCYLCNQWKDDKSLEDWLKEIKYLVKKEKETPDYPLNTLQSMMHNIKRTIQYCKDNNSKISIYKV